MTKETSLFIDRLRRKLRLLKKYSNGNHDEDWVHELYAQREIEKLVKDKIASLEARIGKGTP